MDKERLAQESAALLSNTVLLAALNTIEHEAIEAMIYADTVKRREAADTVKSIRALRSRLELWKSDMPRPKVQVV